MNDFYDDVPAKHDNQVEMAQSIFVSGPAPVAKEVSKPVENNIPEEVPQVVSEPMPDLATGDVIEVIDEVDLKEVSIMSDGGMEAGVEVVSSHVEKAITSIPQTALDPMSPDVLEKSLESEKKRRSLIMSFIKDHLIKDVDYGSIKTGWKKCLYKSGAEKVCSLLHLKPSFFKDNEIYDMLGEEQCKKHGLIAFKCILTTPTGEIVGEGRGSRNAITQEKSDFNKAIKMAQKSGQIDATLRIAGMSDQFSQDLEDTPAAMSGPAPGSARITAPTGGNNYQKYLDHFTAKNDKAATAVANYLVQCNVTGADQLTQQQFAVIKKHVESI